MLSLSQHISVYMYTFVYVCIRRFDHGSYEPSQLMSMLNMVLLSLILMLARMSHGQDTQSRGNKPCKSKVIHFFIYRIKIP